MFQYHDFSVCRFCRQCFAKNSQYGNRLLTAARDFSFAVGQRRGRSIHLWQQPLRCRFTSDRVFSALSMNRRGGCGQWQNIVHAFLKGGNLESWASPRAGGDPGHGPVQRPLPAMRHASNRAVCTLNPERQGSAPHPEGGRSQPHFRRVFYRRGTHDAPREGRRLDRLRRAAWDSLYPYRYQRVFSPESGSPRLCRKSGAHRSSPCGHPAPEFLDQPRLLYSGRS